MTHICPICGRVEGGEMQWHHLKPISFRTRTKEVHAPANKILIHMMCHQKIHATFSEHDLLSHYHTVERLTDHEEMQKFKKWITKKPLDYYDKNNDTRTRKRKRKR